MTGKNSIIILFLILHTFCWCQHTQQKWIPTDNLKKDIELLFPQREYFFDKMTKEKIADSILSDIFKKEKEIKKKYSYRETINGELEGIDNQNFFEEYAKDMNKLDSLKKMSRLTSTDVIFCQVHRSNSNIQFHLYDSNQGELLITLDTEKKSVAIDNKTLHFDGVFTVLSADNVYKAKWKGYKWSSLYDLDSKTHKKTQRYTLTIGQLIDSKKILISIKQEVFYLGQKIKSSMIPMFSR